MSGHGRPRPRRASREYCWTPPGAGVWFVRLFAGDTQLTAKAVALR